MFMTYRKQIMNFRGPGYTRFHKVSGPHLLSLYCETALSLVYFTIRRLRVRTLH